MVVRVFCTDFGLAKDVATGSRLTRTGATLGTPAYMSPEQARGDVRALTAASDVWALGCLLHELLAGSPAFAGDTTAAVIGAVLTVGPPPIRHLLPPEGLAAAEVRDRAMARRVSDRYPDAGALRDDLARAMQGVPTDAARRRRARWRRRTGIAFAIGAALVAGFVLAWRVGGTGATPAPTSAPDDPAIRLASQAWARRADDPGEAAAQMATAVAQLPDRHDLRVQWGLLCWAAGDLDAAEDAWAAVPDAAPLGVRARWLRGLAQCIPWVDASLAGEGRRTGAAAEQAMRRAWRSTADGSDEARWMHLGLALVDGDAAPLRAFEAPDDAWEPNLLVALGELAALRDGRPADAGRGLRALDRVIATGMVRTWGVFVRGILLYSSGNTEGALVAFDDVIRARPRNPYWRYCRARARLRLRDGPGTVEDCDVALAEQPGMVNARAVRGAGRRVAGDLEGARADFEWVLTQIPDDVYALNGLGLVWTDLGDHRRAAEAYSRVLRQQPTHAAALQNRGAAYRNLGEFAAAVEDFTRFLDLQPNDVETRVLRAMMRRQLGDLPGARADLDQAIADDPDAALPRAESAVWREAAGDDAGAIADYTDALARDPGMVDAYAFRGKLYARRGRVREALSDYDAALAREPTLTSTRARRGVLRLQTGDRAGAKSDFDRVLADDPRDAITLGNRGNWYLTGRDTAAALRDYDAAIAIDPRTTAARFGRARIRRETQDLAGARADLEVVIDKEPRFADGFGQLGLVAYEQQDWATAVSAIRRYLELAPDAPMAARMRPVLAAAERHLARQSGEHR